MGSTPSACAATRLRQVDARRLQLIKSAPRVSVQHFRPLQTATDPRHAVNKLLKSVCGFTVRLGPEQLQLPHRPLSVTATVRDTNRLVLQGEHNLLRGPTHLRASSSSGRHLSSISSGVRTLVRRLGLQGGDQGDKRQHETTFARIPTRRQRRKGDVGYNVA